MKGEKQQGAGERKRRKRPRIRQCRINSLSIVGREKTIGENEQLVCRMC